MVDSRYNQPQMKMKNNSLYREFVKSEIEKIREFLLLYKSGSLIYIFSS